MVLAVVAAAESPAALAAVVEPPVVVATAESPAVAAAVVESPVAAARVA